MADKDSDQPVEQSRPVPPWWADIGRRGALVLVVIGGAVAAWIFLGPVVGLPSAPFVPDMPAIGYYQAAKIAAIGLVILGTSLYYGRRRAADAETAEAGHEQGPEQKSAQEPEQGPTKNHQG